MTTGQVWKPSSPCGTACLTRGEDTVTPVGSFVRALALLVVLAAAVPAAGAIALLRGRARDRVVRAVFRAVLTACGVRLVVRGRLDGRGRGALVVTNHVSWLDIVALGAVRPMKAVAKREIASWPFLGRLVARSGTVFLDRERLSTLPVTVARVADVLRAGTLVNVTPEGTTWCGRASGRFRPAFFQAAIDAGVPVRPVALRYRMESGRETTRPAFVGPESLVESIRRTLRLRGLVLEVVVCPEIAPGRAADRREAAGLAEAAVLAALDRKAPFPAASYGTEVTKRSVSVSSGLRMSVSGRRRKDCRAHAAPPRPRVRARTRS
ncbi:lysophospholipid acyltransferase family protein [Saccharomonospora cyanea]|uniref:1-acyl-sn-glycerol-3-phosphate acyltransferase n=1 Tax=Saccharomonospora cyanea NA-134 TaxID=882082 RepID=H5XFC0_9PSEU|nr:lysophospholipid acyltransferase family protein [Saccharomonospora cyanea]EHR62543.1 1-acyl-sn-glycerol-3-phosphate acyltransferase [Saccharomonospora cyanea NA-134]